MQKAIIDLSKNGIIPVFHAKQGDTSRRIAITLLDNGLPYDTAADAVSVWYCGPSGEGNYSDGIDKDGSTLTILLNPNMTAASGRHTCAVMLSNESGRRTTWNFCVEVAYTPALGSEEAKAYFEAFEAGELAADIAAVDARTAKAVAELNARVSAIIASGSDTEGNTELIDIRTGSDGKVYQTAGDAVRGQIGELKGDLDNIYNELSVVDEGIYSSVTISTNATAKNATVDGTTVTIPKDVNCGGTYIGYRYGITDNDKGKRLKIVMPYSTTIPNTRHYIFNVLYNNSGIEFETIVSEDTCTFIVNISKDCTASYFVTVFLYSYYGTYSVSNTITVDYPTFIGLYGNTQRVQKMIDNSIYTNKSNYVGKRLACFGDSYTAQGKWQPHVVEILGLDGFDGFSQSGGTLTSIYEEISNINANADILNVWIGTNDYHNNRKIGNLLDDVTDESTHDTWGYASFCGALNYICNWIATNMPTKTIIFNTPTYRHNESDDTRDTENGRNDKGYIKNGVGNSLEDYANAMIMVANHWGYPVNDLFHNSGINEITYPSFYQTDRLHPSDNGARILARKIAEFINIH